MLAETFQTFAKWLAVIAMYMTPDASSLTALLHISLLLLLLVQAMHDVLL